MNTHRWSLWVMAAALAFAAASASAQTTTTSAITSASLQGSGDWKTEARKGGQATFPNSKLRKINDLEVKK